MKDKTVSRDKSIAPLSEAQSEPTNRQLTNNGKKKLMESWYSNILIAQWKKIIHIEGQYILNHESNFF